MSKTLRVMLAAVFCIIFAQSVFAAVMTNTPMGNQATYSSRTHTGVAPTSLSAQRYLGTGSSAMALSETERQHAYDKAPLQETLYTRLLAQRAAKKGTYHGFRVYQWGVTAAPANPTYGGIPGPRSAVATAAGNVTAQVFPTQNAMNPNP